MYIIGGFQREVSVASSTRVCSLFHGHNEVNVSRVKGHGACNTASKIQPFSNREGDTMKISRGIYNRDHPEAFFWRKHFHVKLLTHAKQEQLLINPEHSKQSI